MDRARLYVDFNEMLEPDLVLLSKYDTETDSAGNVVALGEGIQVYVYMDNVDENGVPDPLIADGVVEKAPRTGWAAAVKGCCRIGPEGIGRNDPCPCGSGKKFKHCHGVSDDEPLEADT